MIDQEFRLLANTATERISTWSTVAGVAILFPSVALSAILGDVAGVIGIAIAVPTLFAGRLAFAGSRHGAGFAVLDETCLHVRAISGNEFGPWDHRYKWIDIAFLEVRPFSESDRIARTIAPILGRAGRNRVAVLRLRRSLRSPFRPPFGTDTAGIPSVFVKQVVLHFEDPGAFTSAAHPFLSG